MPLRGTKPLTRSMTLKSYCMIIMVSKNRMNILLRTLKSVHKSSDHGALASQRPCAPLVRVYSVCMYVNYSASTC